MITGSNTSNCIYDLDGICIDCIDGYYFEVDKCCADNEFHKDGGCVLKSDLLDNCYIFDYDNIECLELI